ncbi:hypothetical protein B296_00030068 [Ensete ventricosum]|uniref:Uncharacterized protein n=1 Tax=Ensete ventricosum TaxID=4639 RepID=A0A426Y2S9_ENSVE|nr:hypothetical protein B296_00030068 [Ensete ventricosum]
MTWLNPNEGKDPLKPRWSSISGLIECGSKANELQKIVYQLQAELESSESRRKGLEEEVSLLRSNLDGSQDDQAQLEGDVLSLTEAAAFLEVELKAEGPKVVATYKASREFETGLEKMGRISYEFGYRVALERLCWRHPEVEVEQDPFAECSEEGNVRMNLCQPFDDSTPRRNS